MTKRMKIATTIINVIMAGLSASFFFLLFMFSWDWYGGFVDILMCITWREIIIIILPLAINFIINIILFWVCRRIKKEKIRIAEYTRFSLIPFVAIMILMNVCMGVYVIKDYCDKNESIVINGDKFRVEDQDTGLKANYWKLYINDNTHGNCDIAPSESMGEECYDIGKDKALVNSIKSVYNNGNVRVYVLEKVYYEDAGLDGYPIVYTVDGNEFYSWNAEYETKDLENKEATEKRQAMLYEHISKETLKELAHTDEMY